jgi:hypothetical protein
VLRGRALSVVVEPRHARAAIAGPFPGCSIESMLMVSLATSVCGGGADEFDPFQDARVVHFD